MLIFDDRDKADEVASCSVSCTDGDEPSRPGERRARRPESRGRGPSACALGCEASQFQPTAN